MKQILQVIIDNIIDDFLNILKETFKYSNSNVIYDIEVYSKDVKKNSKKKIIDYWIEYGAIIIDHMFDLLSECFADICAVLSLNLSLKDYIDSFYKSDYIFINNKKKLGTDISDLFIIRIYIVQQTMINGGINRKWLLEEDFSNYLYTCLFEYSDIVNSYDKYNNLVYDKRNYEDDEIQAGYSKFELEYPQENAGKLWFLFNSDVYENMLSYIIDCKDYFINKMKNGSQDFKDNLESIRFLFDGVKNFEDNPDIINEILLRYKKQLFKELEKWRN